MRTVLSLAIALTLPLLGCLAAVPEPTAASEAEAQSDITVLNTGADPSLIGEGEFWLCQPTNRLFVTQAGCTTSCSTTCVLRVICTDSTGRQVPCP